MLVNWNAMTADQREQLHCYFSHNCYYFFRNAFCFNVCVCVFYCSSRRYIMFITSHPHTALSLSLPFSFPFSPYSTLPNPHLYLFNTTTSLLATILPLFPYSANLLEPPLLPLPPHCFSLFSPITPFINSVYRPLIIPFPYLPSLTLPSLILPLPPPPHLTSLCVV